MLGYAAMFEQFTPSELLAWSQQAAKAGFGGVMGSDHFHPWVPEQGQAGFVWSWLGAVGATVPSVRLGTGVTAPIGFRYHPVIIAQAAATLESMFPGRFYLGIGAGEALNEHVTGQYWPEAPTRLEMLMEAVEIIKKLFTGKVIKHRGPHFTVESARLYTLPATPPPIYIATSGPINAERTGRIADGLITVGAPDEKLKLLLERFAKGAEESGRTPGALKRIIQLHVSWAPTREEAVAQAVREWPNGGMAFPKADIRNPEDFAAMARLVGPQHFEGRVFMAADLQAHAQHIQHFIDLGFDDVYVHNVGRNQAEFIAAYARDVLPALRWPNAR
jgi:coenzyme F420-dependent glucose-6-phosphate dehydrogenase